jgi:hypothetical protein
MVQRRPILIDPPEISIGDFGVLDGSFSANVIAAMTPPSAPAKPPPAKLPSPPAPAKSKAIEVALRDRRLLIKVSTGLESEDVIRLGDMQFRAGSIISTAQQRPGMSRERKSSVSMCTSGDACGVIDLSVAVIPLRRRTSTTIPVSIKKNAGNELSCATIVVKRGARRMIRPWSLFWRRYEYVLYPENACASFS